MLGVCDSLIVLGIMCDEVDLVLVSKVVDEFSQIVKEGIGPSFQEGSGGSIDRKPVICPECGGSVE